MKKKIYVIFIILAAVLSGCGGSGNPSSPNSSPSPSPKPSPKPSPSPSPKPNPESYKGLQFYFKMMPRDSYKLEALSDSDFNALGTEQKLQVANKLLDTLFWGYPLKELKDKIDSGNFISDVYNGLKEEKTDKTWLEDHIMDDSIFEQYKYVWQQPQAIKILTRFYAFRKLDKYYLDNWVAYILTQTILFSPAYELSTTHTPDISQTYNHLVLMLENDSGMRFITYVHMTSQENWRRFRSPEDNGREMLEIYTKDAKDSDVPLAAKTLQNWKLNSDSDTLEVGLNRNSTPIKMFGTTIYTGNDFYREMVKSATFQKVVVSRLVSFFFSQKSQAKKDNISKTIVASNPETWQDILLQIAFSKEYLLHNTRPLSAEERFFSLARKIHFINNRSTFGNLKYYLENMHQAIMKYKLGKLYRVPLDSLSFAWYHKLIRQDMLLKYKRNNETNSSAWGYTGWSRDFIDFDKFKYDESNDTYSLHSFVNYLFNAIIARDASNNEQKLFKDFMIEHKNGKELFKDRFNMFKTYDDAQTQTEEQENRKRNIAIAILDYISRLSETYTIKETK